MDTKFSSDYWSHPQVEAAPLEARYAGAWMRTNDRVTLFGYAAVTPRKFAFETGLDPTWFDRAIEALAEWFVRAPGGYFMPGFIGEQIGRGAKLVDNNVGKASARAIVALNQPEISALVLRYYPELQILLDHPSTTKPFPTPCQGGRAEQSRTEQSGAEQGIGVQGKGFAPAAPAAPRKPKKPGSRLPSEQPEPIGGRMLALNAIFRREPATAWSAADVRALEDSGLLALAELDFIDACEAVRAFYAAKIPREIENRFWRRTTLQTLLNNWAGELDKARAWTRDRSDGLTKL